MNALRQSLARPVIVAAGVVAMAQLALTIAHHLYGALIYDAPFRAHVVFVALPVAVAIAAMLGLGWRLQGRAAGTWLLRLSALVMAILLAAMIGLYEGGYNHVLKDILYFAGISPEAFDRLFPPPLYERPDDLAFELSGVLQFPVGLLVVRHAWRLWRAAAEERP